MAKIQHYGISFPLTAESDEGTLLDLNLNELERVQSEIMHLIFTPKGQRLRNPGFGTNLIQYIFSPSDMQTWDDITTEIHNSVSAWLNGIEIKNIEVLETDNGLGIGVKIVYNVHGVDGNLRSYEIITKI